jgi:hypothetical protein
MWLVEGKNPKKIRRRSVKPEQRFRRTKGTAGKGKGGPTDIETDPPEASIAPTNDSTEGRISNDGSHLALICGIMQSYNDLVAASSYDLDFCGTLESDKDLLCPGSYEFRKLCDGIHVGLSRNESIKEQYCGPRLTKCMMIQQQ